MLATIALFPRWFLDLIAVTTPSTIGFHDVENGNVVVEMPDIFNEVAVVDWFERALTGAGAAQGTQLCSSEGYLVDASSPGVT